MLVEFEEEATRDAWAAATRALQLRLAPAAAPASHSLASYLAKVHAAVALQPGQSSSSNVDEDAPPLLDSTGLLHALQLVGATLEAREIHLPTMLQHLSPLSPPAELHGVDAATFVRIVRWLQHGAARRLLDDRLLGSASTLRHGALSAASFATFWRNHQHSHLPRDAHPSLRRFSISDQLLLSASFGRSSSPSRHERALRGSSELRGVERGGSDEAAAERAGDTLLASAAQGQGWLSGVALCEALGSPELNEAFDGAQVAACLIEGCSPCRLQPASQRVAAYIM